MNEIVTNNIYIFNIIFLYFYFGHYYMATFNLLFVRFLNQILFEIYCSQLCF